MPMWTHEQEEAIYKSGTNIIVSAGAGSGKTAVLTARVIEKLKQGIHINELLILTFTKAAAKEMKERIRKSIKKDPNLVDELAFIDSAYITTFDSYALSIVKKYHYLLNLDRNIDITDASILDLLKTQVMDEVFQSFYEEKQSEFLRFIKDFCIKDDLVLKESLKRIAKQLELQESLTEFLNCYEEHYLNASVFDIYLEKYNQMVMQEKKRFFDHLKRFSSYVDQAYFDKVSDSLSGLLKAEDIYELKQYESCKLPMLPRGVDELVKEEKEKLGKSLKSLKEKLLFFTREEYLLSLEKMKPNVSIIIDILKRYFKVLTDKKKEQLLFDFNDIAMLSLDILKNHESVREEIKLGFKEIMVDEYQDTNDIQEAFISNIENQNVYMVGDIKQSIYRFRNANPEIFKKKYDQYSNLEQGMKIDLLKNFRSRDEVLLNINQMFNVIMDDILGGADYIATHQMVFGNKLYEVNKDDVLDNQIDFMIYNPKDYPYKKEEVEAFYIARDIEEKVKNKYQIFDKDLECLRAITYSDFVILMDRTAYFDLYKKVFTYLNIPMDVYKDEVLSDSLDFHLIKNLFGFYIGIVSSDFFLLKLSFVALARSFLYELSDEEIYLHIKNNTIKESLVYQDMQEIIHKTFGLTIVDVIEAMLVQSKYYEKLSFIGDLEDHMIVIHTIQELALQYNQNGKLVKDFYDYLNAIIESDFQIKYSKGQNASDSVKIMTIHKSKGLEYPICYYSGLYKKFNIADIKEQFMYEKNYGFVVPFQEEGIVQNFLVDLVKDDFMIAEVSEKIRLFYVALTRAREKMIVVLPDAKSLESERDGVLTYSERIKYRSFADMLYSVFPVFENRIKKIENLKLSRDYLIQTVGSIDLEYHNEIIEVNEVQIEKREIEQKHFSKDHITLQTKEEQKNIEFGLEFHECLEYLDFKNPNFEQIKNEFMKTKIEHFYQKLQNFNIDDAKIFQEYEFTYQKQGTEFYGIIDLLIVLTDKIYIIDYKLNDITDEAYINQLNGYKEFIASNANISVDCYLYSILKEDFKKVI